MKKGGILRTILLFIAFCIIIVYAAYPPFLSYMNYLWVKEKCKELAKFARTYKSLEEIKNLVIKNLIEKGFYFSPLNISVYYEGNEIVIKALFSDTLRWFNDRILKPLNYKVEVRHLPVSIN